MGLGSPSRETRSHSQGTREFFAKDSESFAWNWGVIRKGLGVIRIELGSHSQRTRSRSHGTGESFVKDSESFAWHSESFARNSGVLSLDGELVSRGDAERRRDQPCFSPRLRVNRFPLEIRRPAVGYAAR